MYGEIDISYRAPGVRIPVLVNPRGFKELDLMLRDTKHRTVRFQMNVYGIIWFASAAEAIHGDEFSGQFIIEKKNESIRDAIEGTKIVFGTITAVRDAWLVLLFQSAEIPLVSGRGKMPSERAILTAYAPWHEATDGVELLWWDDLGFEERQKLHDLTVEVNNAMRSVVQVKGACNKPATSIQNRYLLQWVNENNLRVRSR